MNTNTLIMEKKENKKMLVKQWARIDSNSSNGDNGKGNNHNYLSPIVYKTNQVAKKLFFNIGSAWVERIGKNAYSYNVIAVEDIIIPAGVYKCYKVVEEVDSAVKNYYWFAPDVGLVKWEITGIKGVLQGCVKDNEV